MAEHRKLVDVAAAGLSLAAGTAAGRSLEPASAVLEVVQVVREYWSGRQERLVRTLLQEAYLATSTDRGAFADFKGMFERGDLRSENAKNIFVQTVKTAEDVIDEAVLPALAMLMREYQRSGRPVDGFFRGLSRTLKDLAAEEYDTFRAIACTAPRRGGVNAAVRLSQAGPSTAYALEVTNPGITIMDRLPVSCAAKHARHVFHLMQVNNLAERQTLTGAGISADEIQSIVVERSVAERIAALVDPGRS
jgi:hypothetical protein